MKTIGRALPLSKVLAFWRVKEEAFKMHHLRFIRHKGYLVSIC